MYVLTEEQLGFLNFLKKDIFTSRSHVGKRLRGIIKRGEYVDTDKKILNTICKWYEDNEYRFPEKYNKSVKYA